MDRRVAAMTALMGSMMIRAMPMSHPCACGTLKASESMEKMTRWPDDQPGHNWSCWRTVAAQCRRACNGLQSIAQSCYGGSCKDSHVGNQSNQHIVAIRA